MNCCVHPDIPASPPCCFSSFVSLHANKRPPGRHLAVTTSFHFQKVRVIHGSAAVMFWRNVGKGVQGQSAQPADRKNLSLRSAQGSPQRGGGNIKSRCTCLRRAIPAVSSADGWGTLACTASSGMCGLVRPDTFMSTRPQACGVSCWSLPIWVGVNLSQTAALCQQHVFW